LRAIYAGVQFIAEHPQAAEQTDDVAVRVKIVRRYRYKSFYSVIGDIIEILHVRHRSRGPWMARQDDPRDEP
jgi:plasmid stabilization system protein ParE